MPGGGPALERGGGISGERARTRPRVTHDLNACAATQGFLAREGADGEVSMVEFEIHTVQSAPEESRTTLKAVEAEYGFIPNLLRALAESPQAVKAYWTLGVELNRTSLTPIEQQVLMLAVSLVNRCPYCMAAHSLAARLAGMSDEDIDAVREGGPLSDPKLEALRAFACSVTECRGWVKKRDTEAFLSAGFTRAQVFEVILGIAYKTMSNYANHVVGTLLDEQYKEMEWRPHETQ